MGKDLLLGIDLGTTVLKAGVIESDLGRVVAQASRRLAVRVLSGNGREQSPPAVARALNEVLTGLRNEVGARWAAVRGIGVAAQGGSTIVADRGSGKPLTPMILWNDGRTHAWLQRVNERAPAGFWRRFLLCDVPAAGLGRLLWLKERRPELFCDDTIHVGAGEFLFHSLTGVWRQDAGNAIQIGSYNARKERLDAEAFDLIDVPISFVAPLRRGHETAPLARGAARRLGLAEGIPVAGPYIDQEAGYMSCLGVAERPLQGSLGTAWVGNLTLPEGTSGGSPTQMVLPSPTAGGRFVVQPLRTGNGTWDWALRLFAGADHAKALRYAARAFTERLLPPGGLVAVPYCTQPNPFSRTANGAGVFLGVSSSTERADLLRAVAGGMAFEFYRMFEAVKAHSAVDALVIGGGASKGPYFRRILAALFAPLPVRWQVDHDLAAARGSLFAMDRGAARSKTRRVPPVDEGAVRRVTDAYDTYIRAFQRVYGDRADDRPFTLRRRAAEELERP